MSFPSIYAVFLSVFRIAPDIQCVWVKCWEECFGLNREVLLGAFYTNPQGRLFCVSQVCKQFTHLYDELACATQVTPDLLLCDHVLVSPSLLKCAQKLDMCALIPRHHRPWQYHSCFHVPDVVPNADRTICPEHACGMSSMGRCAGKLSSFWKHRAATKCNLLMWKNWRGTWRCRCSWRLLLLLAT
eukprot:1144027-Pelagomonas_calceolata.AAC.2